MSADSDPRPGIPEDDGESILLMDPRTLWAWLAVCVVACVPIVWFYAPETWGWFRTLAAGVILGLMSHYMLFINRILVAKW